VELRREKYEQRERERGECDRSIGREDFDRLVAEDRNGNADGGDQEDEPERDPAIATADQLSSRLRRDDAVDREPA
jgi:hypothetical protein